MQRAILAAIVAAAAAATPAAQQPQAAPSFRAGTDLVEIEVVARSANGAFVGDLAIEDFEVRDNGVPQRVEHLLLNASARLARPAAGARAPTNTPNRRLFLV